MNLHKHIDKRDKPLPATNAMAKMSLLSHFLNSKSLFLLLFLGTHLLSQPIKEKWYNMESGLPQNSIKDIIKDKYGFFWLSTENGIVKYDGSKFEVYNDFPVENLNFGYFSGNVENDDIAILSNNEKFPIIIKNRTPDISYQRSKYPNLTYLNSVGYEIYRKNTFFTGAPLYFQNYAFYTKNSKYFFSADKTVFYEKGKYREVIMPRDFSNLKDLPHTFAFGDSFFIIHKSSGKVYELCQGKVSEISDIPALFYDQDAKIYWQQLSNQSFLILHDKIYQILYKDQKFRIQYITDYSTFDTDRIHSIFYDEKYRKLYLGSLTKGLNIIPVNRFHTAKDDSEFADNVYYAILPYGRNSVITEAGKVYTQSGIIENKHFEETPYKKMLAYDDHFNIFYPRRSTIIKRFYAGGYQEKDSIPSEMIIKGLNTSGNKITAVYYKDFSTSYFTVYDEKGNKESEIKMKLDESPSIIEKFDPGFYILGTTKSLSWFSIEKKKITLQLRFNIGLKQIRKIEKGVYLLTTFKNGIYILKNKKLIKLTLDPKKNLATAHTAAEDKKGNFWISSNNGLYKIHKKNILDFIAKKRKKLYYYGFTTDDGLVNNEFNGTSFPCVAVLENGEFVFPSMDGLVFFNPDDIQSIYPGFKDLHLERIKIENTITNFGNKIHLPSDYKYAEALIDIPYYGNLENISLEYKIDDELWKKVSHKTVNLAGLDYGRHDLNIRMLVSAEGDFVYKRVVIEVEPRFYQTLWFRILSVTSLIVFIIIAIYSRTRFLQSKNDILKRTVIKKAQELDESLKNLNEYQKQLSDKSEYEKIIIENIIHDITTPVKFIALISQQLNDATDPETQKEYFESLHASSEHLHQYTLSLKHYSQIYKEKKITQDEAYSLTDFINEKKLLFNEIALHNNTLITNETDASINLLIKKSLMNMILHNLIDNAVKNTSDGYITISAGKKASQDILIEIKDTGRGMTDEDIRYYNQLFCLHEKPADQKYKSKLGLYLVSQITKKIGADIIFIKNQPKGTIVQFLLKHKNTHE